MNIKIFCFIHACILPHVFYPKEFAKEIIIYLFTIIVVTLITLRLTFIGRSKLLPQVQSMLPHLTE